MDEWSFFRKQIHMNKEILSLRKKSQQSLQAFRDEARCQGMQDHALEANLEKFLTESLKTFEVERQHNSNFEKAFKASSKRILGTDEERDVMKKVKWNNHEDKCMSKAAAIVQRYNARGGVLPRQKDKDLEKVNPERLQEDEDSNCLYHWRLGLKGNTAFVCSEKVKNYLDASMPHWRDELEDRAMNKAIDIVARYKARTGQTLSDQDKKDNKKLAEWKKAVELKNQGPRKCPNKVRDYLDEQIPGWRASKGRGKKNVAVAKSGAATAPATTSSSTTSSSTCGFTNSVMNSAREGDDLMYPMDSVIDMSEVEKINKA